MDMHTVSLHSLGQRLASERPAQVDNGIRVVREHDEELAEQEALLHPTARHFQRDLALTEGRRVVELLRSGGDTVACKDQLQLTELICRQQATCRGLGEAELRKPLAVGVLRGREEDGVKEAHELPFESLADRHVAQDAQERVRVVEAGVGRVGGRELMWAGEVIVALRGVDSVEPEEPELCGGHGKEAAADALAEGGCAGGEPAGQRCGALRRHGGRGDLGGHGGGLRVEHAAVLLHRSGPPR